MGASPKTAQVFEEFISVGQLFVTLEAILRVFDRHGDRKNRSNARIRFLIADIGIEKFKQLYQGEFDKLAIPNPTQLTADARGALDAHRVEMLAIAAIPSTSQASRCAMKPPLE